MRLSTSATRVGDMGQPSEHSLLSGSSKFPSVNNSQKVRSSTWGILSGSDAHHAFSDVSLFSTSLPDFSSAELILPSLEERLQSIEDSSFKLNKCHKDAEDKDSSKDLDLLGIGSLLPGDEDELLAGIMDDFDFSQLPSQLEELDECDIFDSGGGMELELDPAEGLTLHMAKTSISDSYGGIGNSNHSLTNGIGAVAGEHPYGEHPSRTLFVRNINSNVEDSELWNLFGCGDIRSLYTACKHRGFVMISYYDIRHARTAMRTLQNKPLRRRKLDIHFSIPKENPSDKDMNQGTLVIFNLDPSVSNGDLLQIFGAYGEVKEIRETPHKRHHKFIEFYDVRAAEAALRSLNRSDIAGKRIKLEPSRPGGARRNLMQQPGQELEHDEVRNYLYQVGSPITISPPGMQAGFGNPSHCSQSLIHNHSPTIGGSNPLPGLHAMQPSTRLNSGQISLIGKDNSQLNYAGHLLSKENQIHGGTFQHSHSFPEKNSRMLHNLGSSPRKIPGSVPQPSKASVAGTLSGSQFLWGSQSPTTYPEHTQSGTWAMTSGGHSFTSHVQQQKFPYSKHNGFFHTSSYCHIGSAPTDVPFERHYGYTLRSPDASFMSQVGSGTMRNGWDNGSIMMNMGARTPLNSGVNEKDSPGFRRITSQRQDDFFLGNTPYLAPVSIGFETSLALNRSSCVNNDGKTNGKSDYQLNLEKILRGEDTRTTIMIKNIPNKYTSNMLLAAIDEHNKGTYDFFYLPIDFKNTCNMGYAFINMLSASHIIPLYQAFDGKKWEKFNSEKVASLAYARIQGKAALIDHFQYSSLMNEDKRCRPILFHYEGAEVGDKELLLKNGVNICVHPRDGTSSSECQTRDSLDEKPETSKTSESGLGER